MRGWNREAGSKVVEEKALEGRNPTRARFGHLCFGGGESGPFPARDNLWSRGHFS
jgi:hypothetical protein